MHASVIVTRVLGPCLSRLHAKRVMALHRAVVAVVLGGALRRSKPSMSLRRCTSAA